jgi:hypothetical protein
MILGPIVGGAIATIFISLPFIAGSILVLVCFFLSFNVFGASAKKESAF